MSWKRLTVNDLKLILSADECDKLETLSRTDDWDNVVQSCIDNVANTWRGMFLARGFEFDVREHFIPSSFAHWVLIHARHAVWTRFPNSDSIALDQRRLDSYDKAMEFFSDPPIGPEPPDPENSSASPINGSMGNASVFVEPHRFPPWWTNSIIPFRKNRGAILPTPQVSDVAKTTDTIGVTWDAVPNAESYQAMLYLNGSIVGTVKVSEPYAEFSGLKPNTAYTVQIRAYGKDVAREASEWTLPTTIQTDPIPPNA